MEVYCQRYEWKTESFEYEAEDPEKGVSVAKSGLSCLPCKKKEEKPALVDCSSHFPALDCFNVDKYVNIHLIWFC